MRIKRLILPFMVALLPFQALALTAADEHSYLYGSEFYDSTQGTVCTDGSSTGTGTEALVGGAGTGPLLGPTFPQVANVADLITRINTYIANTDPSSPFKGLGAEFVQAGEKYDVNPAMVVAIGQKEEQLGTYKNEVDDVNKDSFGTTGVTGYPTIDGYAAYPSYEASIDPVTHYIDTEFTGPNAKRPSATVEAVMVNGYTNGGGADPIAATEATVDVMNKILDGIATTGGASTSPVPSVSATPTPTATPDPCSGLTTTSGTVGTAGTDGWSLSGPNSMVSYNMEDPRWANDPYGVGKSIIGISGCGPTSIAMVVATLTGNTAITPLTIANQYGNQYHSDADGTSWPVFPVVGKDYNLHETDLGTNLAAAAQIVEQGGLVIIAVGTGYFTTEGHIMVIRAVTPDGGSFYLADPAAPGRHGDSETRAFTAAFLESTGNMEQLWGFTK